jgi:transcriptional regulator with XRE-family HTH domain
MASLQEKQALRDKGMTYQQIADHLGISYQAVANVLSKNNPGRFQFVHENGCVYPNLRRWMNENKVGKRELVRRCGLECLPNNVARFEEYLLGRADPPKKTIDKILRATGMSYEEAFWRE